MSYELVLGLGGLAVLLGLIAIRVPIAYAMILVGMIAIYGALGAGIEFFPETTPERVQIKIKAPVGTQLSKTDELARAAERIASTSLPIASPCAADTDIWWIALGRPRPSPTAVWLVIRGPPARADEGCARTSPR